MSSKNQHTLITEIGTFCNYYRGLHVKKDGEKHCWGIENWQGANEIRWEPIPKYLYNALMKYEKCRMKGISDENN